MDPTIRRGTAIRARMRTVAESWTSVASRIRQAVGLPRTAAFISGVDYEIVGQIHP
jgi:hypothetical protein